MHSSPTRSPRWYIFDLEGRLRFAVASAPGMIRPAGGRPVNAPIIGDAHVLAIVADDFGVQTVVVYPLVKAG